MGLLSIVTHCSRGPTRVQLKQSLWLNFTIDTTKRQFGGIEFLLFNSFQKFNESSEAERQSILSGQEAKEPLYTVPAGFRSVERIRVYQDLNLPSPSLQQVVDQDVLHHQK